MLVIAVDAATYVGTVAVIRDGVVLAERSAAMRGARAERLMPAVADALAAAGAVPADLDIVACGAGPGSFTSLRIAASIAKGLAAGLGIPLLVAPSPLLVVTGAEERLRPGTYVAVLDAMRGEVFAQEVTLGEDGAVTSVVATRRAARDDVVRSAREAGARVVGATETPPNSPHARGFAPLVDRGLARQVDVRSWEPDYGRKAEAQVRWEERHGRALEGA